MIRSRYDYDHPYILKGKKRNSASEIKDKLQNKNEKKRARNVKAFEKAKDLICSEIERKEKDLDDCLDARKDVTKHCYGGVTDASHEHQEDNLDKGNRASLDFIKKALGCE